MATDYKLLNLVLWDVVDVRLAGIEHGDFNWIGIETRHPVSGFGKTQGQGKAYVTASDNSNF